MTTARLFMFLVAVCITTSAYIIKPSTSIHPRSNWLPTRAQIRDADRATPAPTGESSPDHTVGIDLVQKQFSILLPSTPGNSENDAVSYCTSGCDRQLHPGFITSVEYQQNDAFVQVTGCLDSSLFPFAKNDDGGQYDVRYPNGAQCTFGGYGASFIQQVEPSAGRFCLRCCAQADDQGNCNSHHDQDGCIVAVPGVYPSCS